MFYKWGVVISYQFLHLTIIQGYSKLSLLDKGFPKGGGGAGVWEKFPKKIVFLLFESVPNQDFFLQKEIKNRNCKSLVENGGSIVGANPLC